MRSDSLEVDGKRKSIVEDLPAGPYWGGLDLESRKFGIKCGCGIIPPCRRAQCITILSTVPKCIPLDLSTFGFGYDAKTGEVHVCFGHNVLLVELSSV